jgi:hypothetical protein
MQKYKIREKRAAKEKRIQYFGRRIPISIQKCTTDLLFEIPLGP